MNPFYFFYKKILHAQEHKKHKNYKKRKDATKQKQRKHKKHKNANKQISYFFPLKCFLCIYKRCLFCFCSLICLFVLFWACEIFLQKKKKVSNCSNDLIYITTMESLSITYLAMWKFLLPKKCNRGLGMEFFIVLIQSRDQLTSSYSGNWFNIWTGFLTWKRYMKTLDN